MSTKSATAFDHYRILVLRTLALNPPLFPIPLTANIQNSITAFNSAKEILEASKPALASKAFTTRPLRVTIYSRQDSSRRRITNVEEITKVLSQHHIVRHIPQFGSRPPAEQLALFAHTDILIAPHGAHMTFSFVLPINAIVIECFAHTEGKMSWMHNLWLATGKRPVEIVGIANMTEPSTPRFRHMDRDFTVNTTQLCAHLRRFSVPVPDSC
jgi:capsular polysaccharide biosynthesis protein